MGSRSLTVSVQRIFTILAVKWLLDTILDCPKITHSGRIVLVLPDLKSLLAIVKH